MEKEFLILLKEENAPLLAGKETLSHSYWDNKQFSIGYGTWSFKEEVIDEPEARRRAKRHFLVSEGQAPYLLTEEAWKKLSLERKGTLTRMIYQLGFEGVKRFKNTLSAIEEGNFNVASDEMLDSLWFRRDTPERAARESCIMRSSQ